VQPFETPAGAGMSETVRAVLADADKPSVIVAPDPAVRGVIAACALLGVRIPEDLGVVSFNEIASDGHHRRHGITAVTVDPHRMGKAAGAAMLAWLAGSRPSDRGRIQTATLHVRGTTAAAPASG